MFAGAAREAVFSNPNVIRRINADFVPVALKARLIRIPPDDEEGRLYREIGRSQILPQGICVVNPACKVLDWVITFDDDKSVLAFLDHALERYAKYPDAKQPVPTQRYRRFPSKQQDDVEDSSEVFQIPDGHPNGQPCPATPPPPEGTVEARLFGRSLDKNGIPVGDIVRQEYYVEDRFNVSVETQEKLAEVLADAKVRVRLPEEFARQFVERAYLGVLDVQPLANPNGNTGELKKCQFWARPMGSEKGVTICRIEGESETYNGEGMANAGPGDMHEVKLTWQGFIELKENRVTKVDLWAQGTEKLKFGTVRGKDDRWRNGRTQYSNEVAVLPGGRQINLNCGVHYGIIAEPAAR